MEQTINSLIKLLESFPFLNTLALTLGILVIFFFLKKLVYASIVNKNTRYERKIKIRKSVDSYFRYIAIIIILLLWFAQIQVVLVSFVAIAAAIVLAFKELIMCLTGGVLIKLSSVFNEGHRIEVDGTRGFVIEKTWLTTKILEIGPEKHSQQTTGDIITIPNSLMLSKSFKNESYFRGFSIKSFSFRTDDIHKVKSFEESILKKAEELSAPIQDIAKREISRFCEKEGFLIPAVVPRSKVIVEDGEKFFVSVKLPIKNSSVADIEQELNRFYLDWCIENAKDSKKKEEAKS